MVQPERETRVRLIASRRTGVTVDLLDNLVGLSVLEVLFEFGEEFLSG